jgi:hypothetical protein
LLLILPELKRINLTDFNPIKDKIMAQDSISGIILIPIDPSRGKKEEHMHFPLFKSLIKTDLVLPLSQHRGEYMPETPHHKDPTTLLRQDLKDLQLLITEITPPLQTLPATGKLVQV